MQDDERAGRGSWGGDLRTAEAEEDGEQCPESLWEAQRQEDASHFWQRHKQKKEEKKERLKVF